MAKSTRQYVFEGMELMPEALAPFVETRLSNSLKGHWEVEVVERVHGMRPDSSGKLNWDQAALLKTMMAFWRDAFSSVLGHPERSYVSELLEVRNKFSHNESFSYDDAERALDSMRRLCEAVSAGDTAEKIGRMRDTILRTKFSELARVEERKQTRQVDISVETKKGLLSWREVVEPHQDVATGDFQQAEFAADLGKVHKGSAPSEYADPREFFARTYLTDGLSALLSGTAKRLSGAGGDPVVELQTNFGGGKTHSMLALYHMAGGIKAANLPGLDQLLADEGLSVPDKISRAVLVGTSRGPQDVIKLEDGREIRTTWGDLAWQLGGEKAFGLIAEHDAKGTAPGSDKLEEIFKLCAPCLILIDEWVAYLRQIYGVEGLPSGTFDANLTFVQSLTEAVKTSPGTLLVASLPQSQIEVGGEAGKEALAVLKQTFSRVGTSWRPASQEESYEIVRRRLFKEIPGDKFQHRDNTLKQFAKMYRENPNDFPQGCADEDYRRKMEKAFPIHPELFDQLYTSWGSLEKFQRTRGVLRLMAQVIHELWMNNDPSVVIMPGSVAISSPRVEPELLKYLDNQWQGIISGDVEGPTSTPYKIDQAAPNLNRYSATRRVARTIFMGTTPTHAQQNQGLDDKQINLGVVQPGERPMIFGDALRRLANQAKFMHSDLGRYWYSTAPSLNRLAADRAAQMEAALIDIEIDKALTKYVNALADRGNIDTVQVAPSSSSDVPDEAGGVRAIVFGVAHAHNGRDSSDALVEAKDILMHRGGTPRVYRNMLVFLAAEVRQLDNLKDAMRNWLAWCEIVKETQSLNLTQSDSALAQKKADDSADTVKTRVKEAWCYLLYPIQETAQSELEWVSSKIPAQDGLLSRASKKLVSDDALFPELGPTRLDRELQKYIWNGKPHLLLKDIWEYLNRYVYLPRVKNRETLVRTVQSSISGLVPGPFAFAEGWDDNASRYSGLAIDNAGSAIVSIDSESVVVDPNVAEEFRPAPPKPGPDIEPGKGAGPSGGPFDPPDPSPTNQPEGQPKPDAKPTRFSGTVSISPDRPARDIHQIIEAIVEQLTTIPGSDVSIKLEINAEIPSGLDRNKVRTLVENANTLGFIEKEIK
ncbi:MAG TPA: AAA family ATPase [Octadecabacter sp.]|nr:AAA family ATPase [Octadecabacter sp.]